MKIDTGIEDVRVGRPAVGSERPDAVMEPAAPPGLIQGLLAAASTVAASVTAILATQNLTIAEHALLSRSAAGSAAGSADRRSAPCDVALLSLEERGLVRTRGGSGVRACHVELTTSGVRELALADAALQGLEARMHLSLASWEPLVIQGMLDDMGTAVTRETAFT